MTSAQTATADTTTISRLSSLMRHWILKSTHEADSGHPTSSLSAVELMASLFFAGHFRYDTSDPARVNNDRLIFSKGHASPLFYSLWAAAGEVSEDDLMTYREFDSRLEGHPTRRFRFTEAATGSLGQGLSIGLGMAMVGKMDELDFRTFVLLGDSEMAEGSQWEAIQIAAHYRLNNLVGILDVNRLGQRGETMYGHDLGAYQRRVEAFGWRTIVVQDGHDLDAISQAYHDAFQPGDQPVMIIAKTVKGKGVSFLEDENGWHGKPLGDDKLSEALSEIGDVEHSLRGQLVRPEDATPRSSDADSETTSAAVGYGEGDEVATRDAYGNALKRLAPRYPSLVSLDGEVSNSTRAKKFKEAYPDRFFEMFIAEQNMVGSAVGMSLRGKMPFVSTFAAFLSRAFDQIRMAPYCGPNIKFVGSHCGVSIGQDGPSQMGLEDIAMFRTIQDGVVLYPCDAVSTEALVEQMCEHRGISYLRTTRGKSPVVYGNDETFEIGGCKVVRQTDRDRFTLIAAGVTLHEAIAAHELLEQADVAVRVIDLYSIKPLDHATVRRAADETEIVFTVEDHFPEGGIGEAVLTSLSDHPTPVRCLAVRKRPHSGQPEKLLDEEGISAKAIAEAVMAAVERSND